MHCRGWYNLHRAISLFNCMRLRSIYTPTLWIDLWYFSNNLPTNELFQYPRSFLIFISQTFLLLNWKADVWGKAFIYKHMVWKSATMYNSEIFYCWWANWTSALKFWTHLFQLSYCIYSHFIIYLYSYHFDWSDDNFLTLLTLNSSLSAIIIRFMVQRGLIKARW